MRQAIRLHTTETESMFTPNRWLLFAWLALWFVSAAPAGPMLDGKTHRKDDPLPPGALARFGSMRFRVAGANHCLAVSPDGKMLAAGGEFILRLWDRATGGELHSVKLKGDRVLAVLFSPNGKHFAALTDSRPYSGRARSDAAPDVAVIVGTVAGGKVRTLARGKYDHDVLVFTPDGKHLLTWGGGSEEGAAVLWDVAGGKQVRRFPHARCYALAPDGKTLAGGTGGERRGSVHLWDVQSGAETRQMHGHRCPVHTLAFSPDGRTLASGSKAHPSSFDPDDPPRTRDNSVRLWDVNSGKERLPPRRHAYPIERVLFAPDGKTFVSLEERGRLFLWDAATGKLRESFYFAGFRRSNALLYSQDGEYLFYRGASSGRQKTITLNQWDITAGTERHWQVPVREDPVLACSPDGKTLFALGERVRAWDVATGEEQHSADGPFEDVVAVDFAPDGKSLLILSGDHRLRLWDIARNAYAPSFAVRDVASYRFTPDRRSLRIVGNDESLSVRDLASGRIVRQDRGGPPDGRRRWSPDGRFFATIGTGGRIHLWDAARGEEIHRLAGHRGTVTSVRFSPDARWLFSVGEDATIQWWDVRTGQRIERFQEEATNHVCYGLSQDSRLLAWACGERIHLWDLAARKEVKMFPGHAFGTEQIELEGDGTILVSTGADDFAIRCWDSRTGREFRTIQARGISIYDSIHLFTSPDGRVLSYAPLSRRNAEYALHQPSTGREICRTKTAIPPALSANGKIIAVLGDKLTFRETLTGDVIAETPVLHRDGIDAVEFSPDGKFLITTGRDSMKILWNWRRLAGLAREGDAKVSDKELATAWEDLTSPDTRKGYRALVTLTDADDKAVTLLRQRLRPATTAERQHWRKWIADLDNSNFAVREKTSRALSELGIESERFLRRAAAEKVSLETRRRLEQILASDEMKRISGDSLRKIRATQVLEAIGTPAARELLEAWSGGAADAWLTQEAKSALRRKEWRSQTP